MINSYLDYLNQPTHENIKLVHKASGMKQPQVAEIIQIGLPTYKNWHATDDKKNHRKPNLQSWNLLLYELEARRLGYANLLELFAKTSA